MLLLLYYYNDLYRLGALGRACTLTETDLKHVSVRSKAAMWQEYNWTNEISARFPYWPSHTHAHTHTLYMANTQFSKGIYHEMNKKKLNEYIFIRVYLWMHADRKEQCRDLKSSNIYSVVTFGNLKKKHENSLKFVRSEGRKTFKVSNWILVRLIDVDVDKYHKTYDMDMARHSKIHSDHSKWSPILIILILLKNLWTN